MRRLFVLMAVLCGLFGCSQDPAGPALLQLIELTPGRAEVGDRVEVSGVGLPEGRKATVTFSGELLRPGLPPERGVRIVVPATSTSATRLGFALTDSIEMQFCGSGDAALHTTFRGEVVAAFAPRKAGAPPVAGRLSDVVLDFPGPTVSQAVRDARAAEGERVAKALGIVIEQTPRGLKVTELVAGGRAEAAGILVQDELTEYEGLQLREPADLAVAAGEVSARIKILRTAHPEPVERVLDVTAVRRGMPRDLAIPGLVVASAALLLVVFVFPGARLFSWLSRVLADRLRRRRARERERSGVRGSKRNPEPSTPEPAIGRVMSYMLIVLASAASATLAFGQPLIAHELDLAVVAASYMLVSAVGGLIFGGSVARGWSLFKGLRGALRAVWLRAPVPLSLVTAVVAGGNMRVQDLVGSQGVAPWEWAVFTNPVLSIAAILLLAVGTIRLEPDQPLLRPAASARGARLAMALDAFHIMVVAHLGAILFLGGWRLPVSGALGMVAAGAFLVQLKAWLVAAVVLSVRWAVPQLSATVVVGIWTRVVVPVSVLVACLAGAWGTRALTLSALSPLIGVASFVTATALCVVFAIRVRRLSRGSTALHVNPWL